jgi:hypothetical protein
MTAEVMSGHTATADLEARLRRHYINPSEHLPGGIFVEEVGVNGSTGRRADAIYIGFTSASGRIMVGHEVKVSRSDWRRELDTVGKADFWSDACHQWYVVAPDTSIVPPEELPAQWGLMVPSGRSKNRMQIVVKAPIKPAHTPPWAAVRSVMARGDTLRAQTFEQYRRDVADQERKRVEEHYAARERREGRLTPAQRGRLSLLEQIEGLLDAKITHNWRDELGEVRPDVAAAALQLVLAAPNKSLPRYVPETLRTHLKQCLEGLDAFTSAVADFDTLRGEVR